ncbi:ABC transporter ATP-binding protein [Niveibacterium microcysteis]|uniref:ABC transporter ATP-binding protein n=1 Tax=Niveibacterium microcysteis TaxID=2811415 RepID=UPI001FE6608F|nr:ABC transporter ATP-binding protein [Niveibacterium microcysteis]
MTESSIAPEPLFRLSGITKTYGQGEARFEALRGIDLEIPRGQFVAVMGPSGSGKSTLMNILGCLDTPTTGEYVFDGQHVERFDSIQRSLLRRHHHGFIFQGFNLLARTSALENVELPLLYRGMPRKERDALAAEALAAVGLEGKLRNTPSELSGGQQQRVAIARAIVTNPLVLFADEPTGNLDTQTSDDVMALITRLNTERGITVLMVTHETDIAAHAQRVVRVKDGRIDADSLPPGGA